MRSPEPNVLLLTGPTASGKSALIEGLPKTAPIEIINADSRQIYRGMEIGTAQPSPEETARYPHHLYSFLEPDQKFSSGEYLKLAREKIKDILSRNKIPLVIGGTFFYIKTLWDGIPEEPENIDHYTRVVEELDDSGVIRMLSEKDPERLSKISPSDTYRIRRSLALTLAHGVVMSKIPVRGGIYNQYSFHSFYLDPPRERLYERINQRTKKMFAEGILEETAKLIDQGYEHSAPVLKTIGYKEIIDSWRESKTPRFRTFIENLDQENLSRLVSLVAQHTRNFAKRQWTWFRNEKRLKSIDPDCAVSILSDYCKI